MRTPPFRLREVIVSSIPPLIAIILGWAGIIILSYAVSNIFEYIDIGDKRVSAVFTIASLIVFSLWLWLWRDMSRLILARSR